MFMTNAKLRAILDSRLRTDGELDSFLIDHYPKTYQQITSGMTRTNKVNLLFMLEDNKSGIYNNIMKRAIGPGNSKHSIVIAPIIFIAALILFAWTTLRECTINPLKPTQKNFNHIEKSRSDLHEQKVEVHEIPVSSGKALPAEPHRAQAARKIRSPKIVDPTDGSNEVIINNYAPSQNNTVKGSINSIIQTNSLRPQP